MKNKIEQFLELMMVGRPCVELRTVKPPKFKMFSDVTEASNWAVAENSDKDVYFTINPHSCDVEKAVADRDVTRRAWILVDIDPAREEGHPASDDERSAAIDMAQRCKNLLEAMGVSEDSSVLVSSGNGAHLYLRVDLPNDDESKNMVRDILRFLNDTVIPDPDYHCVVDQSVFNAGRISKLVGTFARKGVEIEGRVHCKAEVLYKPDVVTVTPVHVLRDIAGRTAAPSEQTGNKVSTLVQTNDPYSWLTDNRIPLKDDVARPKDEGHALLWEIVCPFHPESHNGAYVRWYKENHSIVFGCHGNRCLGRPNIEYLRKLLGDEFVEDDGTDVFTDNPLEPIEVMDREQSELLEFMKQFCELQHLKAEPVDYLVDELIGAGKLTMISGRWKAGKSTFIGDMIRSIAMGQTFLGRKTKMSKVMICSEETADVFGRRYEDAEAAAKQNVLVSPMYRRPTKAEYKKTCSLLRQAMIKTGSNVLVLDTFMATTPMDDENNNSEAQVFMQILRNEILEGSSERTIIMVHHCGKEGTEARGASAISGATDCNVVFDYNGTAGDQSNDRRVSARGRFPTKDMLVTYDQDTGRYDLLGDVTEGSLTKKEMQEAAIIEVLKAAGFEGLSTKCLVKKSLELPAFKGLSEKSVKNLLSGMVTADKIECTKEGRASHYFFQGVGDLGDLDG